MEFRPCIDIHNGKVKQIVGGSLTDAGNLAEENFVAKQDAAFYAKLYKSRGIRGGHVISLNARDSEYYGKTGAGICSAFFLSGRSSGRRRDYGRKCGRVFRCRGEPCDCDVLCVFRWKDSGKEFRANLSGSRKRAFSARPKL